MITREKYSVNRTVSRGYVILMIVGFLASSLLGQNQTRLKSQLQIPDWYLNAPVVKGTVVGAGAGETKMDATVNALAELSQVMQANVNTLSMGGLDNADSTTSSRAVAQISLGRLRITSMVKSYRAEGKNDQQSMLTKTTRIVFVSGTDTLMIKSFWEETDNAGTPQSSHTFSVSGENLTFNSLLNEMKRVGVEMRTSDSGKEYYVLLRYRLPKEK